MRAWRARRVRGRAGSLYITRKVTAGRDIHPRRDILIEISAIIILNRVNPVPSGIEICAKDVMMSCKIGSAQQNRYSQHAYTTHCIHIIRTVSGGGGPVGWGS